MEIVLATLVIGVLIGFFILIPRFHRSSHQKSSNVAHVNRNAASKASQKYSKLKFHCTTKGLIVGLSSKIRCMMLLHT
ncbi:hypothetical protein Dimus_000650 [Dionaea muscipula]